MNHSNFPCQQGFVQPFQDIRSHKHFTEVVLYFTVPHNCKIRVPWAYY